MKKALVLVILILNIGLVFSKEKDDPIVMTVANKEIPMSEFLFLARKDSSVNLLNKKSLENYVELFKNFKLKVADAEALRIPESVKFKDEYDSYRLQLRASYLTDRDAEKAVVREVYDRGNNILSVSHIVFRLPDKTLSKDTLAVYQKAAEVYQKIQKGEDFAQLGKALAATEETILYHEIKYLQPMEAYKAFEDVAYSLNVGEVSAPIRTTVGFHLIRLDNKMPNPGRARIAQILIDNAPGEDELTDEQLFAKANEVYQKALNGEPFEDLVKKYTTDYESIPKGGELPLFGSGEMINEFEQVAFSLKQPGEIAKPMRTRYGYHIIKLLERKERETFEEQEMRLYQAMKQGERNFEIFKGFEDQMKQKFGYTFNPEAYNEIQQICNDYYPTDTLFYNKAYELKKVLMRVNDTDFPQDQFADYLRSHPFSTKTYGGDFLYDVYRLFVREILMHFQQKHVEEENLEYQQLLKEFHDGILLFEISSQKVWDKPLEEQEKLEKEWLNELNQKYTTQINWKVLKKIKKYID